MSPVSEYYGGHGIEVLKAMRRKYGDKKGTRIFYATANKTTFARLQDIEKTKRKGANR